MTSVSELEREIEATRARLDGTIGAIQDRMTLSGMIDEVMGTVQTVRFGSAVDQAVGTLRRNPIPVMILAAGVGWLIHRMGIKERGAVARTSGTTVVPDVPVINTGHARVYDPDTSPRHPHQDSLDSRRDASAHA